MSSTDRYLYLYESVFFISIWVSEWPVSFYLQLMPFTMISEKKESGFLSLCAGRIAKSPPKFVQTLKTNVAGRRFLSTLRCLPEDTSSRVWRGHERTRETSSLSWKHPADLVQFPLRRRLDAQRCSDMRNALPMPRVSEPLGGIRSCLFCYHIPRIFFHFRWC